MADSLERPAPPERKVVDYTKLRPLERPAQSEPELTDKKMRELAYHMSKVPGEQRSAWQVYQDLKKSKQSPK